MSSHVLLRRVCRSIDSDSVQYDGEVPVQLITESFASSDSKVKRSTIPRQRSIKAVMFWVRCSSSQYTCLYPQRPRLMLIIQINCALSAMKMGLHPSWKNLFFLTGGLTTLAMVTDLLQICSSCSPAILSSAHVGSASSIFTICSPYSRMSSSLQMFGVIRGSCFLGCFSLGPISGLRPPATTLYSAHSGTWSLYLCQTAPVAHPKPTIERAASLLVRMWSICDGSPLM